ncbi:hypothetical protein PHLGIDRAFT_67814, partial [Phlebiopsis gigantea 11061_1 CR5-6]
MDLAPSARQPTREPWALERLIHARAVALGHAIDRSTSISYTSHLQSYLSFCKIHAFPIDPTPDTLSFYVVYMSHHIKPSSVETYLSGICHQLERLFPDVRAARRHPLVVRSLAGCKRMLNTPTRRRLPLETDQLRAALRDSALATHGDLLFRAMLLSGFFGLHRLGELTDSDDPARRDDRKLIRRASVVRDARSYGYLLPGHKADRFFDGSRVLILDDNAPGDLRPTGFFSAYLASRDALFPLLSPLWLTSEGTPPTRSWFLSRLRRSVPDPNIAGQSLRAGGATYFASLGWPDDRVQ